MSDLVGPATEEEIAARHSVAHDLASPVRATAMLADMLVEALDSPSPDMDLVCELSKQIVSAAANTSETLFAFAKELDD